MGGSSRRNLAASFGWLNRTVLESSVDVGVLLDRDYLDDDTVRAITAEFDREGVFAHIWERNEIESYLVSASAISRLSGVAEGDVERFIEEAATGLKETTFAQILAREQERDHKAGIHFTTTHARVRAEFEGSWQDLRWRRGIVPGKEILSKVSSQLQQREGKALGARLLSSKLHVDEVPEEMRRVISEIEKRLE